ncbi:MAG: Hpt domain-containing protein [Pseudomonadota bacterium]|nr:Hpt domain-containing protein [Pseudomonadota bacterium]
MISQSLSDSLHWVKTQVDASLVSAAGALEQYVEVPDDVDALKRCAADLRQVAGTLRMLELDVSVLFVDEMYSLVKAVITGELSDAKSIYEPMAAGLMVFPHYLNQILQGEQEVAAVLLPQLNALRAVAKKPPLSEVDIFLATCGGRLNADTLPLPPAAVEPLPDRRAADLRTGYQQALLAWIRQPERSAPMAAMARIAEQLQAASSDPATYRLWWVAQGFFEGVIGGDIQPDISTKQLVGRIDRIIKGLAEGGGSVTDKGVVEATLSAMLYQVIFHRAAGPKASEIRATYGLDDVVPDAHTVAHFRENLSQPSVQDLRGVIAAINEDLVGVKESLDVFLRVQNSAPDELAPLVETLRRMANTFVILNREDLSSELMSQVEKLAPVAAGKERANESRLFDVAEALLRVEGNLEAESLRGLTGSDEPHSDAQTRQAAQALLRESTLNMTRTQEAIVEYLDNPNQPEHLTEAARLLRQIRAAMEMLGLTRPVALLRALHEYLQRSVPVGTTPAADTLQVIADAVVSIEYYLDALQSGHHNAEAVLDTTEGYVDLLEEQIVCDDPMEHTAEHPALALDEPTPESGASPVSDASPAQPEVALDRAPAEVAAPAHQPPSPAARPSPAVDPEILEVFLEEAEEVHETLEQYFPRWRDNAEDLEALVAVRRSFHTLKGSGRMVGAEQISEFAWAVENLLNKVIDQIVPTGPPIVETVAQAIAVLPELLSRLKGKSTDVCDVNGLVQRANALAKPGGQLPAEEIVQPPQPPAPVEQAPLPDPETADSPRMDPQLYEIFHRETRTHLDTLQSFFGSEIAESDDVTISDDLARALHTLTGSAEIAQAPGISIISRGLDRIARIMLAGGFVMDSNRFRLFRSGMQAMEAVLAALGDSQAPLPDHQELVARINQEVHELAQRMEQSEEVETPPVPKAAVQAEERLDQPANLDAGLLQVFVEEGAEILERMDQLLDRWSNDRGNDALLDAMLRELHTFKGSSRMAEARNMGDLTHETESFVKSLRDRRISPEDEAVKLLYRTIDRLNAMLERYREGFPVAAESELLAALGGSDAPAQERSVPDVESTPDEVRTPVPAAPTPWPMDDEDSLEVEDYGIEVEEADFAEFDLAQFNVVDPESLTASTEPVDPGEVRPLADSSKQSPPLTVDVVEIAGDEPNQDPAVSDEPQPVEPSTESESDAFPVEPDPWFGEEDKKLGWTRPADMSPEPEPEPEPEVPVLGPAEVIPVRPDREPSAPSQPLKPAASKTEVPRSVVALPGQEAVRVSSELLDNLLNYAGEVSIYRSRLEQQIRTLGYHVKELDQTVSRLRHQLRELELETEAQILYSHDTGDGAKAPNLDEDFDPLEFDRYTRVQQLSRALTESVADLSSLQELLEELQRESDSLLLQQSRVTTELQGTLMHTRMVPLSTYVARLRRVVRQTADQLGKTAQLEVVGAENEMDRSVLERMLAPLEHLLRNAVSHGLEAPDERRGTGKSPGGTVHLVMRREGSQVVLEVSDDGRGLDFERIRKKAVDRALIRPEASLSDDEIAHLIMTPGMSTATEVTQISGRGVGMGVVDAEIKQFGGTLSIDSQPGQGTRFTVRLPYTLAISQCLLVNAGTETYAVPLNAVEGVVRLYPDETSAYLDGQLSQYQYGGETYNVRSFAELVGAPPGLMPEEGGGLPMLLVKAGSNRCALVVDGMLGSREVVVKTVGRQVSSIRGITGATILGDGRVVLILDVNALVRLGALGSSAAPESQAEHYTARRQIKVLVVDDSITVRRVTTRLLEKHGMVALTARDGVDALALLQENRPDVMLVDIEMPRMDGFELVTHIRNDRETHGIPVVMITSRVGEKHRARAVKIGVNDYLGKPYQEQELLDAIDRLVNPALSAEG